MAKVDSTAVNELIDLGNQRPLAADDGDDMLFAKPAVLPPLPPRTGIGTQPDLGRRSPTIPPAIPLAASRNSRPSLPPPIRTTMQRAAEGTPAPERITPELAPPPRRPTAPPRMPVAAPFEARDSQVSVDIPIEVAPIAPARAPSSPPIVASTPMLSLPMIPAPADMTSNQSWFDAPATINTDEDVDLGTMQVGKVSPRKATRWLVPASIAFVAIAGVGGYFAFRGTGSQAAATAPVAAPAPAVVEAKVEAKVEAPVAAPAVAVAVAAPVAAPTVPAPTVPTVPAVVETPKAEPAVAAPQPTVPNAPIAAAAQPTVPPNVATDLVHSVPVAVRIDSKPSGATVMLVDQGKTTFLGTTPVATEVDPTRTYDLVFTYANKPTQIEHLDPRTQSRVDIVLGAKAAAPEPKREVVAVAAHREEHRAAPAPTPAPAPKRVAVAEPAAPKAPAGGKGVLMVSTKPPCEIIIDGKHTGLHTPQRSIPLAAGSHKITFVDAEQHINKTVSVSISADQSTKLIENLMK